MDWYEIIELIASCGIIPTLTGAWITHTKLKNKQLFTMKLDINELKVKQKGNFKEFEKIDDTLKELSKDIKELLRK